MHTKLVTFFYILVFLPFSQLAQNKIDSLLKVLPKTEQDTNRIKLLFEIEKQYINANQPDSALYYLDQNKNLIQQLRANRFKYDLNYEYLAVHHAFADYNKALQYTLLTIEIAKKNKNVFQKADSYRALFNIYYNLGENEKAIKYALYAIHLSDSIRDTINLPINYGNLARIYNDLGQYQKAIYYGEKGIASGKKHGNTKGLLICLNNTGLAYTYIDENTKAEQIYKEQLTLAYKDNFPRSASKALINLSMLYAHTGQVKKLEKSTKELNEFVETNQNVRLSNVDKRYQLIVNAYLSLYNENYLNSNTISDEGLKLAIEDRDLYHQSDFYLMKIKLNYAIGKAIEAEKFNLKYDSVQRLITDDELSHYMLNLEKKYETEKKEQQILLQNEKLGKRRVLITVLLLTIIGLLITGLLYFRYHRLKQINQNQKIKQLETDKQLLATASVIKGEEQERSRLAKDLHDGLGGMLSGIKYSLHNMKGNLILTPDNAQAFERSLDMLDSSIKEMRRVAHNMMPEALVKFGLDTALNDFCSDINQSSGMKIIYQSYGLENQPLEQSKSITVYRIVQELINNALKHSGATETLVQLSMADNKLSITVEDNGKGFETDLLQSAKGIGWSNIQNRVDFLKGKIDIHSKKDEGTSVLIEIKLAN